MLDLNTCVSHDTQDGTTVFHVEDLRGNNNSIMFYVKGPSQYEKDIEEVSTMLTAFAQEEESKPLSANNIFLKYKDKIRPFEREMPAEGGNCDILYCDAIEDAGVDEDGKPRGSFDLFTGQTNMKPVYLGNIYDHLHIFIYSYFTNNVSLHFNDIYNLLQGTQQ